MDATPVVDLIIVIEITVAEKTTLQKINFPNNQKKSSVEVKLNLRRKSKITPANDGVVDLKKIREQSKNNNSENQWPGKIDTLDERPLHHNFCQELGGKIDIKIKYTVNGAQKHVIAHCVTSSNAWISVKDSKRFSKALENSIFISEMLKIPAALIIFDTDGKISDYEHYMMLAAHRLGIYYSIISENHYK